MRHEPWIAPIEDRLERNSMPVPFCGCIVWVGSVGRDGYGRINVAGKTKEAHRVAYEAAHGKLRSDECVDHLCRNRLCINIAHLEAVSFRENVLRGEGACARNARKTHCKNGHPLVGENLSIRGDDGWRRCRECAKLAERRYRARKLQKSRASS